MRSQYRYNIGRDRGEQSLKDRIHQYEASLNTSLEGIDWTESRRQDSSIRSRFEYSIWIDRGEQSLEDRIRQCEASLNTALEGIEVSKV